MSSRYSSDYPPIRKGPVFAVLGVIIFVILVIFMLAAATFASVPPDKYMLHYTGGPIQGTHFKALEQPGTGTQFLGLMENTYYLPATQRTYTVSKDTNGGDKAGVDFLTGVSNDNVQFTFEASVYFKLNPNPATIRQFFEQVCLHDHCTDLNSKGKGWDAMLDQYFRPQLENALRLETGKYNREKLYRDPATLVTMQNDISAALKSKITAVIGGEFFCGPDATASVCPDLQVVIKNPTPPDSVVKAYADSAAATQAVVTAGQQAAAKVAAADGDRDAQNARAEAKPLSQAQIDYQKALAMSQCAQNSNCTLVITEGGTGVNVNAGGNGTAAPAATTPPTATANSTVGG